MNATTKANNEEIARINNARTRALANNVQRGMPLNVADINAVYDAEVTAVTAKPETAETAETE